MTFEFPHPLG